MNNIEERKQKEADFHNEVRTIEAEKNSDMYKDLVSRRRFYTVTRSGLKFIDDYLKKNCVGKKVLDYCCGTGPRSFFLAQNGADIYGMDISSVSIESCKKEAIEKGLGNKTHFSVMDGEKLEYEDNYFDLIMCGGVLHHLDIEKAYKELSRVVKPEGKVMAGEPLMHNPIFQLYRRSTPHLRTEWEMNHILKRKDVMLAKKYFGKVEMHFFHLAVLLAVPFRKNIIFKPLLWVLEKVDAVILKIPGLKWWAWQIVFIMSNPKK